MRHTMVGAGILVIAASIILYKKHNVQGF